MPGEVAHWKSLAALDLERLRDLHLLRQRRVIRPIDATHVEADGRRFVNFSSNNYLGLTHHPRLIAAMEKSVVEVGVGSGAAPLISGYGPANSSAERAIARWKQTESAIILPSGYQANLAAIQTITDIGNLGAGVRFLVDKLAHASLIDAIRGSGQPFRVFPHNHMGKLQRLLEEAPAGQLQAVVTESIFSMDGDAGDLSAIAQLKQSHDFLFVVDEAHATGVYGPAGAGLAAEMDVRDSVDVTVFTLSKALGGIGGVVCGSAVLCDSLINHGRAYLFSTGVPAYVASTAEAAVSVLQTEPRRQTRVRDLARMVRAELNGQYQVPAGDSPIIPIILGEEKTAVKAARQLSEAGILVMPVRPPTVPRGSSRLRVTLSSEHTDEEIEELIEAVKELKPRG